MKRINFKVRTTFSAELLFQTTQFTTEPEPEHRPTAAPSTHLFIQRVQEDGRLHRLSQTHLVCQDGVGALSPGEAQPVEPLQLVGMQRPTCAVQVLRLALELYRRLRGGKRDGTETESHSSLFLTLKTQLFKINCFQQL